MYYSPAGCEEGEFVVGSFACSMVTWVEVVRVVFAENVGEMSD